MPERVSQKARVWFHRRMCPNPRAKAVRGDLRRQLADERPAGAEQGSGRDLLGFGAVFPCLFNAKSTALRGFLRKFP